MKSQLYILHQGVKHYIGTFEIQNLVIIDTLIKAILQANPTTAIENLKLKSCAFTIDSNGFTLVSNPETYLVDDGEYQTKDENYIKLLNKISAMETEANHV